MFRVPRVVILVEDLEQRSVGVPKRAALVSQLFGQIFSFGRPPSSRQHFITATSLLIRLRERSRIASQDSLIDEEKVTSSPVPE